MANSDYTTRSTVSGFCPHAVLASSIVRLQTSVTMSGYTSPIENGIRIGKAAMIGNEIVSIDARSDNTLTIGRGCCDTIPQEHAAGTSIWFFDDSIGNDTTEFVAGETIGVKVLPRTATGGAVPVSASPPQGVTFNRRFARPYPPGNVRVDGQPWFENFAMSPSGATSLTLTWAHRDRITQADQLIPHGSGNVGPESGVTYTVVVRRVSDGVVLRTVTGLTGTTWTYTIEMLTEDVGRGQTLNITFDLQSVRDGLASMMTYISAIAAQSTPAVILSDVLIGTSRQNGFPSPLQIPAHAPGDLIIVWCVSSGSGDGSAATPPGFSTICANTPPAYYKQWTVSSYVDTDGTFTQLNTTSQWYSNLCVVLRGVTVRNAAIRRVGLAAVADIPFPDISLSGSSIVLAGAICNQSVTMSIPDEHSEIYGYVPGLYQDRGLFISESVPSATFSGVSTTWLTGSPGYWDTFVVELDVIAL